MYTHGFTSEFAVVGDVETLLEEECPVLVVPIGKAVPDHYVVQPLC
jgi:hypothetical protein